MGLVLVIKAMVLF